MRVYVIDSPSEGRVKIGVSQTPYRRLAMLQVERKDQIFLRHETEDLERSEAFRIEKDAHTLLAEHRKDGEWFCCSFDDAIAAIATVTQTPLVRQRPKSKAITKNTRLVSIRLDDEGLAMLAEAAELMGSQRAAIVAGLKLLDKPDEIPVELALAVLNQRLE